MTSPTPANILLSILEKKWALDQQDKDMVVMQHQFVYEENNQKHQLTSSMVCKGQNQHDTAMSKTVGLPLAIATELVLAGKINLTGVLIPTYKEIYEPVLKELTSYGISFLEVYKGM